MGMPMQILLCYPSFSCITCLLHPCCKEPKASHALGPQPEVSSLSAGNWSRLSCPEWKNMQVCANQVVEGFSVPLIFVSPEFNKFLLKNKNLAVGLLELWSFLSACVNWAAIGFSTAWGLFQQDKNPYHLLNTKCPAPKETSFPWTIFSCTFSVLRCLAWLIFDSPWSQWAAL